jgi:beta-glucosidase
LPAGEPLAFSARITNESDFGADAVVEVYLSDDEASVRVPSRQLVWFRRVSLETCETREVTVEIPARLMAVVLEDGSCRLEPGWFTLTFGGVQPDPVSLRLSKDPVVTLRFPLTGESLAIPY